MAKAFGFELLAHQAGEQLTAAMLGGVANERNMSTLPGDSPIEKLLFYAVNVLVRIDPETGFDGVLTARPGEFEAASENEETRANLVVESQVSIEEGWRVDFLFHVCDRVDGIAGWRSFIVECDGHDFHERTKEQAARDRSRDRAATLRGRKILRFTGSELWNDPLGCARQVVTFARVGV